MVFTSSLRVLEKPVTYIGFPELFLFLIKKETKETLTQSTYCRFSMERVCIFDKNTHVVSFVCEIFKFCEINIAPTQQIMTAVPSLRQWQLFLAANGTAFKGNNDDGMVKEK